MSGKVAVWTVTAAVATVLSGVAVNQVLDNGQFHWPWLVAALAVTLAGGLAAQWLSGPATGPADPAADAAAIDRTLTILATAVEAAWKPEQARRRMLNPRPLPTAWTTIGPSIADHWANVRADGVDEPLDLSGVVDAAHPDAFHRLVTDPRLRGRVVLLGDPGAGKTALLIRLTLTLLAARGAGMPVPLLLRLSTWNPDEQSLEQWLATRLEADYGFRRPVPPGRLMPLLDGLDEMPERRRQRALLAISATFTDAPLVLTSRTTEYLDALAALADNPTAAAALVELSALPAATVRDYLRLTTARPDDWADAFARDTAGRLAAALSAPLWVDLARAAYTDPGQADNDPAELLARPDADAVRARLLDRLVDAAYPDPPVPGPDGRVWRRDDARRWLRHLAVDLYRRDTQDLAWWQLSAGLPWPVRLGSGIGPGLVVGGAVLVAAGLLYGPEAGLVGGLVSGTGYGLAAAFEPPPPPSRRDIGRRRTGAPFLRRLAGVVPLTAAGLLGGGVAGLAAGTVPSGLVSGFAFGLIGGLLDEFTTFFKDGAADVPAAADPSGLLRGDRRRLVITCVAYGLAGMCAVGFFGLGKAAAGLVAGFALGLLFEPAYGAWGRFELARLWWAIRGRLPWPVMRFLADAHRRGVMRQAGGVWQFRHALLRDRLAEGPDATAPGP